MNVEGKCTAPCQNRPHPPTPELTKMLLRSCFGDFEDCPCDDECVVSEYCAKYHEDHEKNSCGMTSSQCGMVQEHEKSEAARAATLAERENRDCGTCPNNHNAKKYVDTMRSCTITVSKKRKMDELKSGCSRCRSNGVFTFDENKCRGYSGCCEQSGCRNFVWWHSKCNCRIIREYDEHKESLRQSTTAGDEQE